MSAFVMGNHEIGYAQFGGVHSSQDSSSIKQTFWLKLVKHKKKVTFIAVSIVILAVGLSVLVYFLKKGSSSKSTLPKVKETSSHIDSIVSGDKNKEKSIHNDSKVIGDKTKEPILSYHLGMERDMKKGEDPCYDFYEYSCGGYIDRYLPYRYTDSFIYKNRFRSLEENIKIKVKEIIESMRDTKDPFFKKAHLYHKACMSGIRSMEPYFKAADKIGGSDITTIGRFDYAKWNLEDALKTMHVQYNANPLFKVHVSPNLFNTSRNILTINPPDFTILSKLAGGDKKFPSMSGRNDDVLEYDLDVISSLVHSFSTRLKSIFATSASSWTGRGYYYTWGKIFDAITFERTLIRDVKYTFIGSKIHNIYKIVKVGELNKITNYGIRWSSLLQSLSPVGSSFNINSETEVGLRVPLGYLNKIKKYVSSSHRNDLPNFFAWFLLKKFSPVLPDDYFAQYYFNAPASSMGTKGKEKWRACMLETETTMPLSVGLMFTKRVITPLVVSKLSGILAEIQSAFKAGSKQLTWLDQATKYAVEDKIKDVLNKISSPDLFKGGWLNDIYKDVTVIGRTYAQIFESSQRNMVQLNLKRYFQPAKRDEFDFGGTIPKLYDVNAFYDRTRNLIRVLSGIMQPPFVYEDAPSYINFAKIGAVLGHELLHGFDNSGWNFDKFGQISPWTTKHSQDGFKIRADCVRRQYGSYFSGSEYVNGTKTLGENIADNAGLKYAYLAYKNFAARHHLNEIKPPGLKDLSYDQLFFIGYAQMWCSAASDSAKNLLDHIDVHSPHKYRVIGSISNFKPFADAFKCRKGRPMNPIKRCEFW